MDRQFEKAFEHWGDTTIREKRYKRETDLKLRGA